MVYGGFALDLYSLGPIVGKVFAGKIIAKGFDKLSSSDLDNINIKFGQAIHKVSETMQDKYPTVLGGSIEDFFKDEDILDELIKLLFKQSKINVEVFKNKFDLKTLPNGFLEEFILELKTELLKDQIFDEILSNNQLYISILGIDENVQKIANSSELSKDDIRIIKKLLVEKFEDRFNLNEFFVNYTKNALNNLIQINFFGLGIAAHITKSRKDLFNIYVKSFFKKRNRESKEIKLITENNGELILDLNEVRISLNELLEEKKHIVILGDPGAGKSLLVKFLICSILSKRSEEFINQEFLDYLPLRIELRKFLVQKRSISCNFTKYLKSVLETEYGITEITETKLIDILKIKKSIVFFDGLDEIFDINDKNEIKNDIENFVQIYKNCKAVVTSRFIGYQDAKLNEGVFEEYEIVAFDDDQIEDYVNKWYELEEFNEEIRKGEVETFLKISNGIEDELLTNPLLLSLIVILYRYNRELPGSKLEIYRSCTKTLVEKWEANKQLVININEKMNNAKENIFSNLAYWQYVKLSNKRKININYFQVSTEIASILKRLKLTDNDDEADKWAEDFLDYAQKRSLYFDNNFTHKTFLEYYTAYYIYKYYFHKGEIKKTISIINKYIENPFWEIVLELLMNIIDEHQGDNDVIDKILNQLMLKKKNSTLFILRILPSLNNVSEGLVKDILTNILEEIIKDANNRREIFSRLKRLINSGKCREPFQFAFDEVYGRLFQDQEKINYFAFYYEINSSSLNVYNLRFTNATPKLINKHIQDQQYFQKLSPYLLLIHSVSNETDFVQDTVKFIQNFGIDEFYYLGFRSIYTMRPISKYVSYFLSILFLPEYITSLSENLDTLKNYGITSRGLSVYIFRNVRHFSYFTYKESIYHAIDLFAHIEDKDILLLLIFWLNSIHIDKSDAEEKQELTEYAKSVLFNSPYLDLILSTFEQEETKKSACSSLGFSYDEIRKEAIAFRKMNKKYKDEAS